MEPTPSQTIGPFFGFGLPYEGGPALVADGDVRIRGEVRDGDGEPVPDALIELWQADPDGRFGLFGRCPTGDRGQFEFVTVKPGQTDGQAPHVAVSVFARGLLQRLVTRIYFPDEADANAGDAVLGLVEDRDALVAVPEDDGSLRFDINLQGDRETPFFAL
ncbi:MAG: protocatechuate 3,4-dioxygenase, alpha subunit [Thermoleophilaceae bacterium]|jgi:protocatechuate 3,4-dioxygenase alpha subunit|nr:protocatechuate 3,4-dioxygenase, alpha subunit [Thermoleophilaceae bacterium]